MAQMLAKDLPGFVKIHEPLIKSAGALFYDAPVLTRERT